MRASSLPPSLAHLPNAAHIDWVLQSVKQNPALWNAAWDDAWDDARDAAWDAARVAAWDAARDYAWDAAGSAAWDAARGAARDAARVAAGSAARVAAWGAARVAAWGAAAALTAWDHAGVALHMPGSDFAGAMALDPHLILLVPARYVLKQEKK